MSQAARIRQAERYRRDEPTEARQRPDRLHQLGEPFVDRLPLLAERLVFPDGGRERPAILVGGHRFLSSSSGRTLTAASEAISAARFALPRRVRPPVAR